MNKKNRNLILLITILAIGFVLRIYNLNAHSYRALETGVIKVASLPVLEIFKNEFRAPIYCFILHWWIKMFSAGEPANEFVTRLLSTLFSTAAIASLYFLILKLKDRKTALVVSFLTAISPFYVLHSRVTEDFAILLLLISLSILFFIKLREEKNNIFTTIAYVLITILMLYSGPVGGLTLLCEWCWLLLRWQVTRQKLKLWIITQGCIVLAYIYWAIMFLPKLPTEWAAVDRMPAKLGVLGRLAYTFYAFSIGQTIYPWHWLLTGPAIVVFGLLVIFGIKSLRGKYRTISFIVPLFVINLIPLLTTRGAPEYCIGASIAYLILIATGITELRPRSAIMALCILTYLNGIALYNLYTDKEYHNRSFTDDWRTIASTVNKIADDSTKIIAYRPGPLIWYYKKLSVNPIISINPEHIDYTMKELVNSKRIIFIENTGSGIFSYEKQELDIFKIWLENNFNKSYTVNFGEEEVYGRKRSFIKRDFPEFRTNIYVYDKPLPKSQ